MTGASGFIGKALLNRLSARSDIAVRAMFRGVWEDAASQNSNAEFIRGDMRERESIRALLERDCVVVNLAYSSSSSESLRAATSLAQGCVDAQVQRLVHCSTATVVGATSFDTITEETACDPRTEYEVNKLQIEELFVKASQGNYELAILRPTAVFGSGGANLLKLASDLHRHPRLYNYGKSCLFGRRTMNLVCVQNVVTALEFLIRTEHRLKKDIFIISDDESPTNNYREVEYCLMKRFGFRYYRFPPVTTPASLLSVTLRAAGRSNSNPRRVYRCDKLVKLGFAKEISFESGLEKFADWYQKAFHST